MVGANAAAGKSSSEHVAGEWYSVPKLRLRDHRFTVPLDTLSIAMLLLRSQSLLAKLYLVLTLKNSPELIFI
ncbi:hypothetical protein ACOSP7_026705 [Xanthoceras sorbifolium]